MRAEDLARLVDVAGLLRDRDTARLAAVRQRIAQLDAEVAALDRRCGAADADMFGLAGRADDRWRAHAREERKRLMARRAALAVKELTELELSRRAVGRHDVLGRIASGQIERR